MIPTLNRPDRIRTSSRPVLAAVRQPGVLALALAAVLWGIYAPAYLIYTVNAAMPVAMAALGLLVLVGWGREISLATAGLFASAMYIFGYLNRPVGGPGIPWVVAAAMILGLAVCLMAGLALISGRLPGIYLVMLTLGVQVVIERTVFVKGIYTGGLGGGDENGRLVRNRRPYFFGIDISGEFRLFGHTVVPEGAFYAFSLLWLALVLVLLARLRRSPYGLAFLLVGADRHAASAVGIPALRFRAYTFATSGLLTATGGILGCWLYVNPPVFINFLSPYSLVLLAIPVLAGLDSIAFVLVVAVTFQVVPVVLEHYRIGSYILAGVSLLIGAAFGSRGMGGRAQDLSRFLWHGPRRARTARNRLDAAALRTSDGLSAGGHDQLRDTDREHALEVLEAWLPPRPDIATAVEADGIDVRIGAVDALRGASITVPAGRMVGLVGPNGAGKSTLFDVISGLREPTAGRVRLFGSDVTALRPWDRSKLGMARTFQTTRVITDLTVRDNLLAGAYQRIRANPLAYLAGSRRAWDQLRAAEEAAFAAAQLLDIDRYWNERCGTLEFSARRRTEIGRCLLSGPRLLLMDEPAAGLDPASTVALFGLVRKLHSDLGLTVLLVEHYVKAVLSTCDLVYVLAEGRVLAAGSPEEIARDPEVRARYLGTRMLHVPKGRPAGGVPTDASSGAAPPDAPTDAPTGAAPARPPVTRVRSR